MELSIASTQFSVPPAYTVDFIGIDTAIDQTTVMSHTISVLQHLESMHNNALKMSLHIYKLRQHFDLSKEDSWEKFCQRNFAHHGLSVQNIRTALRIGKLADSMEMKGRNFEHLAKLRRSALMALADAPAEVQMDAIDQVVSVIEVTSMNGAKGVIPRAKDVEEVTKRLNDALRQNSVSESIIQEKDKAIARLNSLFKAKDEQASGLVDELNLLNKKLSQVRAQEIVHVPDPKIKNAEETIESLQHQISVRRDELTRIDHEINELKGEQTRIEAKLHKEIDAQRIMASLEEDIKNLTFKFSEALVVKMKKNYPPSNNSFQKIASKLRLFADQIDGSLS